MDHPDCPQLGSCPGFCVEGDCAWPAIVCWDGSVMDPNYVSCETADDCPPRGCGRTACVHNQCAWYVYDEC